MVFGLDIRPEIAPADIWTSDVTTEYSTIH